MPIAAIQSRYLYVRYEVLLLVDSFTFELQPERLSHRAVAAIGANQEVRSHDLAIRECRLTLCSVCVNVANAIPNPTSPPSAFRRWRKIVSVQHCGAIHVFG